jgi:hypothetical protein
MKQTTKRKLALGAERIKTLVTELQYLHLQHAHGGKSLSAFTCSRQCETIDQDRFRSAS